MQIVKNKGIAIINVKNERTNVPISFWNETRNFGIVPQFVLLRTDSLDFDDSHVILARIISRI